MDVLARPTVRSSSARPVAGILSWLMLVWSLVLIVAGTVEGRFVATAIGVALLLFNFVRLTSPAIR